MAEKTTDGAKRRDFLKLAGLGTAAGAAVVATGGQPAEAATTETPPTRGYRVTDHVRKAYDTARF